MLRDAVLLLMGSWRFTDRMLLFKAISKWCPTCCLNGAVEATVEHIFFDCPEVSKARNVLIERLNSRSFGRAELVEVLSSSSMTLPFCDFASEVLTVKWKLMSKLAKWQ